MKLRHIAAITVSNVDKKSVEGEESVRLCNYTDVYNNARIEPDHKFMVATASPEQIRQFALRAGDVLITKDSETPDDIGVPAYVTTNMPDVLCGYHLAVLRPRPAMVDGRYLYWAVAAEPTRSQFDASAFGITRFGLRKDAVANVTLPLPHLRAQRAVADFLDTETARLDQSIVARRKVLELLDVRFAVLAEDLTTGRTLTDVRSSGTTWMPTVAADWSLPAISQIFKVGSGTTPQSDDGAFYDGGIPWVNTGDLSDGPVVSTQRTVSTAALQKYPTLRLYPSGSLVVAMYGATIGKLGILETEACVNQACCVLRHQSGSLLERWAFFWMLGHRGGIISMASGGGQPNISQEDIRRLRIPLPKTNTLSPILARLEREHASKAEIARGMERQIDLLTERRQSLITAAVTGQIPIPGIA